MAFIVERNGAGGLQFTEAGRKAAVGAGVATTLAGVAAAIGIAGDDVAAYINEHFAGSEIATKIADGLNTASEKINVVAAQAWEAAQPVLDKLKEYGAEGIEFAQNLLEHIGDWITDFFDKGQDVGETQLAAIQERFANLPGPQPEVGVALG